MPTIAITHDISPDIDQGERTWVDAAPIDLARADQQHLEYRQTLASLGVEVINVSVNRDFPDSVFIEDPVVIVDEVAVLTRPGAKVRRGETAALEPILGKYRTLLRMEPPVTLDGGDVLQIGRRIFVGQSTRTNRAGYEALGDMLRPYGYEVTPVAVRDGCLHLVTGATALDNETVLVAPGTVDEEPFAGYRIVHTPAGEAWAANVIPVGGEIMVAAGYPGTAELISGLGHTVRLTEISEMEKAEGSLTCLSLIFSA